MKYSHHQTKYIGT